ncbi:VOC family protein [Rhodobacteraceae bacterium D3-12]|nr:VOC family protein [Rhodobacteraceae bacterium D3-12]
MSTQPVLVWCEIPVRNLKKACEFYSKTYGYEVKITEDGPNPTAVLNNETDVPAGNLYVGEPGAGGGVTVHLALAHGDTVEAASARATEAGATITGPLVEMPFGRWTYATDPDGNSIGLFQAAG